MRFLKIKRLRHWPIAFASAVLLTGQPAHAFKLVPITMNFEPSGRHASQVFQIENDGDQTIAVQVNILVRSIGLDGAETSSPAEDDFIVYPPQILLKAKQVQAVRVKWIGNASPTKELAYRICAEQLPVKLAKQSGEMQINVVLRYLGTVYILPKNAKPNLVVESAIATTSTNGVRQVELVFQNRGNAHALLRELNLDLQSGENKSRLGPDELKGVSGENILAGERRRFRFPCPETINNGPVKVDFNFDARGPNP